MHITKLLAVAAAAFASLAADAGTEPIKHRFLAVDESRSKLHYVDQTNPANDWSIEFPGRFRDLQLIGGNRLLVSATSGYREYDLSTHAMVKDVVDAKFAGTMSARRMASGHTIICGVGGKKLLELDAADKIVREATFPTFDHVRLIRLTPGGNVLTGSVTNHLAEVSLDGKIIKQIESPDSKYIYQGLRLSNGNLLLSTGYKCTLEEYDGSGQCVWKAGGKPAPDGLSYLFFAGMQVLKNGDVVVATWTGHKADDSKKGQQIVQFNRKGEVVWKWHDPVRAGSIHGVIVLDDLDTSLLNDDCNGVLGPINAVK